MKYKESIVNERDDKKDLPRIDVDRPVDLGDTKIDGEPVQPQTEKRPTRKTRLVERLPEGEPATARCFD